MMQRNNENVIEVEINDDQIEAKFAEGVLKKIRVDSPEFICRM